MVKVMIDPGHGGKDSGTLGLFKYEKEIVLDLSLKIKQQLLDQYDGVEVILTRSTDVYPTLTERTDMANKLGADILLSVHCNGVSQSGGGFESFRYTKASAASQKLQQLLHNEIMTQLKPYGVRDRGIQTKNLHMCRESKMPSVLTENLFIGDKDNADLMKRSEVIQALVGGHVKGIASYLGLKKKESVKVENERDINVVSPWAKDIWGQMTKEGYFDGKRPGAPFTREEAAIVLSRILNKIK